MSKGRFQEEKPIKTFFSKKFLQNYKIFFLLRKKIAQRLSNFALEIRKELKFNIENKEKKSPLMIENKRLQTL